MEKVDVLAGQMLGQAERIAANGSTHAVLELTTLSFLLDHQLATLPELETRIQQVRGRLPPGFQDSDVTDRLNLLIDVLRDVYGPKRRGWTPQVIEGGLNRPQKDDPDQT
jgi:hypothetical protein